MSNRELPQRWADRMVERGFTDPRYTTDIPSLSSLAKACGIHTSTISSAIKGTDRQPSAATIVALTKALGDDVAGWLGENHAAAWEPPAESSLLTGRQRKAVEEIIRAMTERREDVGQDAATTKQAGASPAADVLVGAHTRTPTKDELAELRARQESADGETVEHITRQAAERDDEEGR